MIGEKAKALRARQPAWGLNGQADNQGLSTLNSFWEICPPRCHSVSSVHEDKSHVTTREFFCTSPGGTRGTKVKQDLVEQL